MFKKIIISIFLLLIVNGCLQAGDSIRTGNKALLFQISEGSFHPRSFVGGIGYQFYFNNNTAIRLPLGFGTYREVTEKPINTETDKILNVWNLRFTPGIRYNFGKGKNVLVYTGAQFMFDYADSTLSGSEFKTNEKNSSVYNYGIGLMLGAEYFPWKSLSFGLEYSPFLTFSGGKTKYISGGFEQTNKLPKVRQFRTNFTSVLLIISFWFD